MKFTKIEVDLCRQIAEKYRKEMKRGDWYIHTSDEKNIGILQLGHTPLSFKNLIPLWTIEDCLEFLRENKFALVAHNDDYDKKFDGSIYVEVKRWIPKENDWKSFLAEGETDLEALLKVVLAVLEKK